MLEFVIDQPVDETVQIRATLHSDPDGRDVRLTSEWIEVAVARGMQPS